MDDATAFIHRRVQKISARKHVKPETRLWHDLHLGGDDAFELLEEIRQKFGTSFSTLDFAAYFPDETEAMGAYWAAKLGFKGKWTILTVQHLSDVVARGAWFDPR